MSELAPMAPLSTCSSALASGPLLVSIDDPAHARVALRCALHLGKVWHRSVEVVHEATPALTPSEICAKLGLSATELDDATIWPIASPPVQGLLLAAQEHSAAMIVMGLPALGRPLGAVREQVLAEAPCPILLVPSMLRETWGKAGRVLLPLDGTPSMANAIPLAVDLVLALNASLDIVHVAGEIAPEPGALTVPQFLDRSPYEWAAWRKEFFQRFCTCQWGGPPPITMRLFVRAGAATDAIRRIATERETDLVVLGWRGNWAEGRAATLRALLSGAGRPVVVIRLGDESGTTGSPA
jgi:nucleotide-binding universal stress UspA family protein